MKVVIVVLYLTRLVKDSGEFIPQTRCLYMLISPLPSPLLSAFCLAPSLVHCLCMALKTIQVLPATLSDECPGATRYKAVSGDKPT